MTKVTILGAGITGMAIAARLPKDYEITIVARDLPEDKLSQYETSQDWASPWAGAVWVGMKDSSKVEQRIQLDALAYWWQLALSHPESSVKRTEMVDILDTGSMGDVWYRYKVPNFRILIKDELPPGAGFGVAYDSIILTPAVFLPWLRRRLEASGVQFKRAPVRALSDLRGVGHDVLINATGIGPKYLKDVKDHMVLEVRGQTVLVKTDYEKTWIRRGKDYTYCFARGDGTAVLGGIKQYGSKTKDVDESLRNDIFRRVHEGLPEAFPSPNPKDFEIVRDIVGIRPQRDGGLKIEKEILDGQKVIHAYGTEGGGYVYSWGLARQVANLVDDFKFEPLTPPHLVAAKL